MQRLVERGEAFDGVMDRHRSEPKEVESEIEKGGLQPLLKAHS